MAKPPVKKREPTLRELLERDAKNPLRTIGINDNFNDTPVENAMGNVQDELTANALLARTKQGYNDFQKRQVPLGPPSEYNPNTPAPKPISTTAPKLLFDILTMAGPAGQRKDTEEAIVRQYENKKMKDRQRAGFINQVGQGFAPRPEMGRLRDLLGVTNKKAGSK